MKRTFILITLSLFTVSFYASAQGANQRMQYSLNGRTFYISTYDVNYPDKKEADTVVFNNGTLTSRTCSPYGFKPSAVAITFKDSKTMFTSVGRSDKEGMITWNGTVDGKNISGNYLWHKEGQNDIRYEFSGDQK